MIDRYREYQLTHDSKPKFIYEYWASGTGEFPFDMLRYDQAWPVSSEDAYKLGVVEEPHKIRSIRLRSYRPPTIDRWSSFTWSVGLQVLD